MRAHKNIHAHAHDDVMHALKTRGAAVLLSCCATYRGLLAARGPPERWRDAWRRPRRRNERRGDTAPGRQTRHARGTARRRRHGPAVAVAAVDTVDIVARPMGCSLPPIFPEVPSHAHALAPQAHAHALAPNPHAAALHSAAVPCGAQVALPVVVAVAALCSKTLRAAVAPRQSHAPGRVFHKRHAMNMVRVF